MSGLEAAASLFGSEDASSDPFASLGSESSVETAPHEPNGELFTADSTGDFLNTISDSHGADSVHGTASPQTAQNAIWSGTAQEYGYDATLQNINTTYNVVNHGLGGQWATQSSYEPNSTAPPGFAAGNVPANTYDPYAPSYSQDIPHTQSAYSATVSVPQSNYYVASQPAVSPQPAFNPYTPSQTTLSYGTPAYKATAQTPYALQNTATVPPPPAPKMPLNRPKVSNAYDPPFPATTRKSATRTAPTTSPAFSPYTSASPPLAPPAARAPSIHSYTSYSLPPSLPHQGPPSYHSPSPDAYGTPTVVPSQYNSTAANTMPVSDGLPHHDYDHSSPAVMNADPYSSVSPAHDHTVSSQTVYAQTHTEDPYIHGSHTIESKEIPAEGTPELFSQSETGLYSGDALFNASIEPAPTSVEPTYDDSESVWPSSESSASIQSPIVGPPSSDTALGTSFGPPYPRETSPVHYSSAYTPSADSDIPATDRISSPFSSPKISGSPGVPAHSAQSSVSQPKTISSPPPTGPPKRTSSAASTRSYRTQSPIASFAGASDTYRPRSSNSGFRVSSPTVSPPSITSFDPYAPKVNQIPEGRVPSPAPLVPMNGMYHSSPYLPNAKPSMSSRDRSMSNGSVLSTKSEGPYAPSNHSQTKSTESEYGPYTSRYDYPNSVQNHSSSLDAGAPQDLLMKTHTPYAPSPSLLGTNDPLGRSGVRMPVFSFGFGGKIVSCFHGADKMNTGFDVALASRNSTGVEIRILSKIIPDSALNASAATFPGPLFSDPGSPTTSIVRAGATSQIKTKKARVIKYLTERADELSQGIGYLHTGSLEQGRTESKLVLIKMLKLMVENDGKLCGTPSIDASVRSALVPHVTTNGSDSDSLNPSGFTSIADLQGSSSGGSSTDPHDAPITVTTLRRSALTKIQDFLLRGERRQAYHYALDQKLWAHAMVISSGIDKEAWKEVVNEFLKTELGVPGASSSSALLSVSSSTNGLESLRVAYSLLSGQGAGAVQQLVPQSSLSKQSSLLPLPTMPHATPMTPNFAVPMPAANIPLESLSKWAETVAMMLSGTSSPETSAALTALGDQLAGNGWIEAAHVCYLLSPQTSPIAGPGLPSGRIILLGARNPTQGFSNDPDSIIFSEILEFALSLVPISKGQEPFGGLPHLQAYRFLRAICLAEVGDIPAANRYCEAISAAMTRGSPYFTNVLIEQLKGLSDRIIGVTHIDKPGTWIGGKLSKPSLDSIGGWLEGRFAKLVTGDIDDGAAAEEDTKTADDRGFVGPFSQYSTISSTTTSTSPSPQTSMVNLNAYAPPPRTGSSLSTRSALANTVPADRGTLAVGQKPVSGSRVTSAGPGTTTFAQSRSFGQALSTYSSMTGSIDGDMPTPRPSLDSAEDEGQEVMWWGSNATPTASTFVQGNDSVATSSEGFISLMDATTYPGGPSSTPHHHNHNFVEEDEEDLGFGNSKSRLKPETDAKGGHESKTETAPEPDKSVKAAARPDIHPAPSSSGSWLSRWWKREATPGPVKASLGEETSFYYDKDLKRWVNKRTGGEDAAKPAAPPPPPSRARTVSPGMATVNPPSVDPNAGPRPPSTGPPQRSASAVDLTSSPPERPAMRIRSNLVPTPEAGSAPSTPTGSRLAPPGPPGRPRSQASKRNVRSRYVDVFQQEGAA